jgi:hypothetical protein
VTIAILSFSNIPLAQAEEAAEAVVDATGDVDVQAEEEPVVVDEPVEEEPADFDGPVEEESEESEEDAAAAAAAAAEEAAAAEAAAEAAAAETEEEKTNIVGEVTETAASKISEIVGKIKDISPQQKKKIAVGALGVWGVAAGAGWVLNNLGGSDDE